MFHATCPLRPSVEIRPLGRREVGAALGLIRREGWAYTRADVERLRSLDPGGNPCALMGGRVVGLALTRFNGTWGFLGTLVVHPRHRGQRCGRALVEAAIDHLTSLGARSVGLDAADGMEDYHRDMGFATVDTVHYLVGRPSTPSVGGVRLMEERDLEVLSAFDGHLFAGERKDLLVLLRRGRPHLALVGEDGQGIWGYLLCRGGRDPLRVGPWVVAPGHPGGVALGAALKRPIALNTPGRNREGLRTLLDSGMVEVALLRRMFTNGQEPPQVFAAIYGTGGPEKG